MISYKEIVNNTRYDITYKNCKDYGFKFVSNLFVPYDGIVDNSTEKWISDSNKIIGKAKITQFTMTGHIPGIVIGVYEPE